MLTDTQRRYILNAFKHIESEAQEGLASLEDDDAAALFPQYRDLPPAESIARLRSHLARMRSLMRRFMDSQGIERGPDSSIDASWAFQTRMALARNTAFELAPSRLRGYGPLDAQGEADCRALAAELGLLLDDIGAELRRSPLEISGAGKQDELVVAIVEAIESHHLLELRPVARDLLRAMQGGSRIEVAFLGRVSSGKSSLVNAILETSLLPVGAIPVTSVVTRVQYGEVPRVRTLDVDGHENDVAFDQLALYITESGNSDNQLRLREVLVDLPHPMLKGGVVLTDTPGLGSLHPRASSHALTYLPRCDLGIVAVDCSATLQPQDVDLVRALTEAHASFLVTLTKADNVSNMALEEQRNYVQNAMSQALNVPVNIASVSVMQKESESLAAWQADVLAPALREAQDLSDQRTRARLVSLGRRVAATLEQVDREDTGSSEDTASLSGDALAALEDAESASRRLIGDLVLRGAPVILKDATSQASQSTEPIGSLVGEAAGRLADDVVREISEHLKSACASLPAEMRDEVFRGAPPFVFSSREEPSFRPSASRLPWIKSRWKRAMNDAYALPLAKTLQAYGDSLNVWLNKAVGSLRSLLGRNVLATDGATHGRSQATNDLNALKRLLADPSVATTQPRVD